MTQVCRQIGNESNKPGSECKHKFRKAGRMAGSSVVAESMEGRETEGQEAQLRLGVAFSALFLSVVRASDDHASDACTWISLT